MARSVEDLTLAYRIISGPDGFDIDVHPVTIGEVPHLKARVEGSVGAYLSGRACGRLYTRCSPPESASRLEKEGAIVGGTTASR